MRGGLSWKHFTLVLIPFIGWLLLFAAIGLGIWWLVAVNIFGVLILLSAPVWLFGAVGIANRLSRTLA